MEPWHPESRSSSSTQKRFKSCADLVWQLNELVRQNQDISTRFSDSVQVQGTGRCVGALNRFSSEHVLDVVSLSLGNRELVKEPETYGASLGQKTIHQGSLTTPASIRARWA